MSEIRGLIASGEGLEIEREGDRVIITIACASIYRAMLLYDLACREADRGLLTINVMTSDEP